METMGSQNVPKFPRKAPVRSAQIHSIYKQAAAVPIPTRGYLSVTNEHVTVTSDWSYIDAESQEQIGFTVSHRAELSKDGRDELGQFKCVQSSTDIHSSIISITTSEGKLGRKAVHRKCLRRGKEVDLLTICALDAEMWTYDPQKYGYHGRILSKGNFASCEWSRQEDKLLFVAERTKASRRHRVEPTVMLPTRTDGPSESNSSDHSKSDSGHPSYFHSFECQQKSSGPSEMNSHPESDAAAGNGNVPEPMSETSAKKEHKFGSSSKTGNYNPESKLSFGASYDNETVCPIIAVLKVPKIFFPPFENDANFDLLAPPEASKGYEEAMEGDADDDESDVNEVDIDEDAEDRVAILEASRHKREKLQLILIHMANVSLGQAVFTPDGKGVVFVGMPNGPPYRPGVSKNRIQRLYHFDVDTRVVTEIGNSNKYIYSPRFSAPGDCLLYLQNESGGTNDKASELYCVDWKSKMAKLITTVPEDPRVDEFPGLYQTKLIPHCTNAEGNLLYVQTQWHFTTQVLQIDLRSRAIMNVSAEVVRNLFRDLLSWELLCVKGDYILLACSSLSDRPNLVVGRKTRCDTGLQWSFQNNQTIYGCPLRNGLISYRNQPFYNYTNDLFEMRPDRQPDLFYSAVHLFPQNRNHPLIVVIHGGPHSAFTTKFSSAYEFLQRLDYGLLLVNYRGSTGYGEKNLRSLTGHVGTFDVDDVHNAVQRSQLGGLVTHVVVLGEGHGGAVALHLATKYPKIYKGCFLVNPTFDLYDLRRDNLPDMLRKLFIMEPVEILARTDNDAEGEANSDSEMLSDPCAPVFTMRCFLAVSSDHDRIAHAQALRLYTHLKFLRTQLVTQYHLRTPAHKYELFRNIVTIADSLCASG